MIKYLYQKNFILRSSLRQYKRQLYNLELLEFVSMALGVVLPILNMNLINLFIYNSFSSKHLLYVILYLCTLVLISIFNFYSSVYERKTELSIEKHIRSIVLSKLIKKSKNDYVTNEIGETDTLLKFDISIFIQMLKRLIFELPMALLRAVVIWVILSMIGLDIAVLVLVLQLVIIYFQIKMGKKIEYISENIRTKFMICNEWLSSIIDSIKDVKYIGADKYLKDKYSRSYDEYTNKSIIHSKLANKTSNTIEILLDINLIIILCIGSIKIYLGNIGVGALILLVQYVSSFFSGISSIFNIIIEVQGENQQLCNVINILENKNQHNINNSVTNDKLNKVVINTISFKYPNGQYIFKNASAEIKKGMINYILGPSGVGKTTLLKLIEKEYSVSSGSIFGVSSTNNKIKDLSELISLVPQNNLFYTDTVYNNIVFDNEVAIEKVIEICKLCYIYDDIMSMNNGFDTILSKGINNFSGGQLKRLSLARSLVQNKEILLLDEPTAGLDTENSKLVLSTLMKISKNKIVIVITHDNYIIKSNENTYMIENKKLVKIN